MVRLWVTKRDWEEERDVWEDLTPWLHRQFFLILRYMWL